MTYKSIILTISLLFMTVITQAQYNQVNDISYTESTDTYAQERCKLDVYYPTNVQDAPVVVWFHGGGIEGGEKHIDPQLRNSGLVVVAANYRLLPKASIDDILDDAAAAVAWTSKNIAKYGGSKRKIFLAGHSAGGYLLDIIGLDKRWLAKYGIDADSLAALVPFSGQCVTHYNIRKQQGIGRCRLLSTNTPRLPMSVPTLRPSSLSPATASWNSSDAMRSRPTSGAC